MNPPSGADDVGDLQSSSGFGVNRPPPTLSSPNSPSLGEGEAHQPFPNSTVLDYRFQAKVLGNDHPVPAASSKQRERSNSPSLTKFSSTIGVSHKERDVIVRSYAPHVVVYASTDVEELVKDKGLTGGFATLLRPFGEHISGKVIIRDSHGISRAWEDFGIRIRSPTYSSEASSDSSKYNVEPRLDGANSEIPTSRNDEQINWTTILKPGLNVSQSMKNSESEYPQALHPEATRQSINEVYSDYLQKLLSSDSFVPYETFNHPVACLVAVSSRNSMPIETLRQLYGLTGRTNPDIPVWMGTDYLRYYILVHDEDKDDVSKSVALFDLMKRHFGLHCHLLRLRSFQCASTDDDSFKIPSVEWLSARECKSMTQREGKCGMAPYLEVDG